MEWGLKAVLSSWTLIALCSASPTPPKVYTNSWAVQIPGGQQEASRVAREHGFINLGQ